MQRKIPSAICKTHPYASMWNSVITTVLFGQKSGLWNILWHVKTDGRNTNGITVTRLHGNAALVQLRYRLLLEIWKWDWKLSDCSLVTVKAERKCIKLINRMYQNFHVWSQFWNGYHHTFCLALQNVCDMVSNNLHKAFSFFFWSIKFFFVTWLLCSLLSLWNSKIYSHCFLTSPHLMSNLLCLSMHLKPTWTFSVIVQHLVQKKYRAHGYRCQTKS